MHTPRSWKDTLCTLVQHLVIAAAVCVLAVDGYRRLTSGAWVQVLVAGIWMALLLVGYRLVLKVLNRPVVVTSPASPPTHRVHHCVVEKCGEAWVLREQDTHHPIFLEEGDWLLIAEPLSLISDSRVVDLRMV
jgi:hypothetical protein